VSCFTCQVALGTPPTRLSLVLNYRPERGVQDKVRLCAPGRRLYADIQVCSTYEIGAKSGGNRPDKGGKMRKIGLRESRRNRRYAPFSRPCVEIQPRGLSPTTIHQNKD